MTATDGAFESGLMAGGVTFSQVFDTPGTYDYVCAIHPEMRGTVTVAAPPDPAAGSDPAAGGDVPVSIVDMVYAPATVEVTAGTTVRWTNDDASSTPSPLGMARSTPASCRPGPSSA